MKYFFAVFSLAILIFCSSASAEIFECRDNKGRVSFGDTPCPIEQLRTNKHKFQVWQDLQSLVTEGYEVYSALGPDVYSIIACMEKSKDYNARLEALTKPLNKLGQQTQTKLKVAVDYLKECGECRVSAPNYCSKASKEIVNILAKN